MASISVVGPLDNKDITEIIYEKGGDAIEKYEGGVGFPDSCISAEELDGFILALQKAKEIWFQPKTPAAKKPVVKKPAPKKPIAKK
jgi:hypothetical protein